MRSGQWHRSDRLLNCLPRDLLSERTSTQAKAGERDEALQQALDEALRGLTRSGMLETLSTPQHGFDEAWTALTDCLFVEEARQVYFSISKKKAKG